MYYTGRWLLLAMVVLIGACGWMDVAKSLTAPTAPLIMIIQPVTPATSSTASGTLDSNAVAFCAPRDDAVVVRLDTTTTVLPTVLISRDTSVVDPYCGAGQRGMFAAAKFMRTSPRADTSYYAISAKGVTVKAFFTLQKVP